MENLRDTGIDIIKNVSWGSHISFLYESKQDFHKILPPFIHSGLKNNELCIWIYSEAIDYEEAKSLLQFYISDIDAYLEKKQLIILPYTRWYSQDKAFDGLQVTRQWQDLTKQAIERGYNGLRAVGDVAWLNSSDYRDFEEYEHKLYQALDGYPFIALCLYDINKIGIPEAADIIKNHGYTLIADSSGIKTVRNMELLTKEKQLAESKRLLNETLKLSKLKDQFFSNISHEFRIPLNVILSALQLLKQQKNLCGKNTSDPREDKYLKMIQQNCYRLLRLVNNIIDISRIESDYYELQLQNYDIAGVVRNITMSVAEYIEVKGIKLSFEANPEELTIACDPDQIERIILNLLSNATKFTDAGGSIHVKVQGKKKKVLISVKDTGAGIPREKLSHIFDRFRQVDMSFTRAYGGSGIGLSLVKSLVEKHGGKISVNSEPGKGSEFIIELPRATIPGAASNSISSDEACAKNHVERINIEFSDIYL